VSADWNRVVGGDVKRYGNGHDVCAGEVPSENGKTWRIQPIHRRQSINGTTVNALEVSSDTAC
jgi:hypothetical protein